MSQTQSPANLTHVFASVIPVRRGDMDAVGHTTRFISGFLNRPVLSGTPGWGRERKADMETAAVHAHCSFIVLLAGPDIIEGHTCRMFSGRAELRQPGPLAAMSGDYSGDSWSELINGAPCSRVCCSSH